MPILSLIAAFLRAFPRLLDFVERITTEARKARADNRLAAKNAEVDAVLAGTHVITPTRGVRDSSDTKQ